MSEINIMKNDNIIIKLIFMIPFFVGLFIFGCEAIGTSEVIINNSTGTNEKIEFIPEPEYENSGEELIIAHGKNLLYLLT